MIVAPSIIDEIYKIYQDCYKEANSFNQNKFIKNKKKIKIVIDTIFEQSVENITKTKPRNHQDARMKINQYRKNGGTEQLAYLKALENVLSNYEILIEKQYIDYTKEMENLLENSLVQLCREICNQDDFAQLTSATELRMLLGEL